MHHTDLIAEIRSHRTDLLGEVRSHHADLLAEHRNLLLLGGKLFLLSGKLLLLAVESGLHLGAQSALGLRYVS